MSFAIANIKKYQSRQRKELLLNIGYHLAEVMVCAGIFLLGIAIVTL